MDIKNNPVYSKDVLEFVTVASEYTRFVEQTDDFKITELIDKAHKLLPLLYLKATLLPDLDSKFENMNQRFVNEQDYNFIRQKVLKKLGQYDSYEEIFTPFREESDEAIGASISENLADIYQDINVMYEAIWECKQSFSTYWGQRLTNALRALHFLRYSDEEIDDEVSFSPNEEANLNDVDTSDWIITRRQEDNIDDEGVSF
jgi:hypothetical protein